MDVGYLKDMTKEQLEHQLFRNKKEIEHLQDESQEIIRELNRRRQDDE